MEKLIKKYHKKFSKAIVTQHTDNSIKISWNFGSFAVINVDDKGTETLHFAFDKGLIKLGLDNILNHFNAQDEQTDITDKFKKDRFIVDLDIRASGLEKGKKSFMNCEITLFTNGSYEIRDIDFKTDVNHIIENIIDNSVIPYSSFTYYKSKRG